MELDRRKVRLVRALMMVQSVIALVGLIVKIAFIVSGYGSDWEAAVLPPLSIFVVASALLPVVLGFVVGRRIRGGKGVIIGIEAIISAYSLVASLNEFNISLMVNVVMAVLIIVLLVGRENQKPGLASRRRV
ncbi:hypothetical protein AB0J71_31775 [Nonomuraea sp. NPDC049637]|uniref:hypothetical protein n=1 Tax=Nonomuraea sp. NPDC049637 TaxID=3154356 RepID=UPI0034378374